jgi:hypothetical protein
MKALVILFRVTSILLGCFFRFSSVLDILGLVPYSEQMPGFGARLAHSAPLALGSIFLLAPYRFIRSVRARTVLAFGLWLILAWAVVLWFNGVSGYVSGRKSWLLLPVCFVFVGVVAGNLWAFSRITRKATQAISPGG